MADHNETKIFDDLEERKQLQRRNRLQKASQIAGAGARLAGMGDLGNILEEGGKAAGQQGPSRARQGAANKVGQKVGNLGQEAGLGAGQAAGLGAGVSAALQGQSKTKVATAALGGYVVYVA